MDLFFFRTKTMLNRRQVRIKVFHALYAFFQGEENDRARFDKALNKSFDDLFDLFLLELNFLVEVRRLAQERLETEEKKYFPSEDKVKEYRILSENSVLTKLEENLFLEDKLKNLPYSLDEDQSIVAGVLDSIMKEDWIVSSNLEGITFKKESELVMNIFNAFVAPNEELHHLFLEKNIHWADDIPLVNSAMQKFLKGIKASDDKYAALPVKISDDEIIPFGRSLFIKTLNNNESTEKIIVENVKNWELDRIALIDLILIKMAMTEFLEFKEIPVKVTINEYIEICKDYSTPKSKVFVNGVLDKSQKLLKEQGKLVKTGRGLL